MVKLICNVHYFEDTGLFRLREHTEREAHYRDILTDTLASATSLSDVITLRSECDERDTNTSTVFPCSGLLRQLRSASIVGVTLGIHSVGSEIVPLPDMAVCTMG
jgi:hypothetical protein